MRTRPHRIALLVSLLDVTPFCFYFFLFFLLPSLEIILFTYCTTHIKAKETKTSKDSLYFVRIDRASGPKGARVTHGMGHEMVGSRLILEEGCM